jgi:hypothetical protein
VRDEFVDDDARPARQVTRARPQRMQRNRFPPASGQHPHHRPVAQRISRQPGRQARDTESALRREHDRFKVVDAAGDRQRDGIVRPAVGREAPLAAALGPAVESTAVPGQIGHAERRAVRDQIARRRAQDKRFAAEEAGVVMDAVGHRTAAHGEVVAFLDKIDAAVRERQLEPQPGMARGEPEQDDRQAASQVDRHRHPQTARDVAAAMSQFVFDLLKFRQHAQAAAVQRLPIVGEALAARRAVKQPRAEAFFEPRDALGDGRARHVHPRGCGAEASAFDGFNEGLDSGQVVATDMLLAP